MLHINPNIIGTRVAQAAHVGNYPTLQEAFCWVIIAVHADQHTLIITALSDNGVLLSRSADCWISDMANRDGIER